MLNKIISSVILFSAITFAAPKLPEKGVPDFIVKNLDVTSFPSSIGPRRAPGKTHFADYNIEPKTVTESDAELAEKSGGWRFYFKVLKIDGTNVTVCFTDQAMDGGTYHTVNAMTLQLTKDGRLKGSSKKIKHADCPEYRK